MTLPILGIVHVNVNCSDPERSAAWYRRVPGLVTLGRPCPGPGDEEPAAISMIVSGGCVPSRCRGGVRC